MIKKKTVSITVLLFVLNGLILTCGFFYLLKQNILSVRTVAENQTEENLCVFGNSLVQIVSEHLDEKNEEKNIDGFLKKFNFTDSTGLYSSNSLAKDFRITLVASDGKVIMGRKEYREGRG